MRIFYYSIISVALAGLSFLTYYFQNRTFHHPSDTVFYFFQDLAFLPVQILLGVLIIDNLVRYREKKKLLNKMNMVIGVFFAEAGNGLLTRFVGMTANRKDLTGTLLIDGTWSAKRFISVSKITADIGVDIELPPADLEALGIFLGGKREPVLRLLENPNLMEHERFTDLLWAVSHLTEELSYRKDFLALPPQDIEHLKGDIIR
ncbi:MAG TPA: hypothetical protein PKK43_01565, partial [Spirochaetota bacterium]|nr:hypothetical protein [Spirochaetota bacterium]